MQNLSSIDGSPACLRFPGDTSSKSIEKFIQLLEQAVESLNIDKLNQLRDRNPLIQNIGSDDFYLEVMELIQENLNAGTVGLKRANGYCHNCLPDSPVIIFGKHRSKIAFYYHFEAITPVEIHLCSYCDTVKCNNETIPEWYTNHFSIKNRPKDLMGLLIKIGEALFARDKEKLHVLFANDITYKRGFNNQLIQGKVEVTKKFEEVWHHQIEKNIIPELQVVFLGINQKPSNNIDEMHGLPMLSIKILDKEIFLEIEVSRKKIKKITTSVFNQGIFSNDTEHLWYTGYFLT